VSRVLTITQTAAEAIDSLVASTPDLPESGGLRIEQRLDGDGTEGFGLSIVDAPQGDDQIIEGPGTSVFLDPEVAPVLDDKVLDARVEAGELGFVLAERG